MSSLRAFTMPKWGIEMVEGIVSDWQVDDGDAFSKGDVLVGIETDKIVNEVAAEYDAVCLRRLAEEGDTLGVGELLAVFGDGATPAAEVDAFIHDFVPAGGDREAAEDAPEEAPQAAPSEAAPKSETPVVSVPDGVRASDGAVAAAGELGVDLATVAGVGRDGRIQKQDVQRAAMPAFDAPGQPVSNAVDLASSPAQATDIARRLARRDGIELDGIEGSGRDGRVRARDLPSAAPLSPAGMSMPGPTQGSSPAPTPPVGSEPFSNMRKQIARRLTTSYQTIPHYHVQMDVFVDALLTARRAYNTSAARKSSLNDWLVRAVALALSEHPDINIHVGDETITRFAHANVAIAVAIDGGLMTPVLKSAETLDIAELSARSADLVTRARDGALTKDDLSDGTFTVSNLGMFGVSRFTAIINPPQGAILAIGAARPVPTERDGRVAFGQQVTLTLACDHRAIDGAVAGRFLSAVRERLEQPERLLN